MIKHAFMINKYSIIIKCNLRVQINVSSCFQYVTQRHSLIASVICIFCKLSLRHLVMLKAHMGTFISI
jgi:hypothetical protein